MHKKLTLGIDLGGTGIKMALVDPKGKLQRTVRVSTPSKTDPREVTALIIRHANRLIQTVGRSAIRAIGVGSAGDVDPVSGVVRISPNLRWRNVPLKSLLRRYLKYPITVENDANVAAWAAYVVESHRRVRNLICVTLGTGVGGGIVLDGKLYRGTTGSAGEIGHITLYPDGVPCPCGNKGCLERYVGARAMAEEARRAIETGEASLIADLVDHDLSRIEPLIVQKAAYRKDSLAVHLWEQTGERLGIGLASLVNVLNPECVVLAGGLSRAGRMLLHPLRRTLRERSFPTPARAVKLMVSRLDQDLGMVGAGLVAHELQK